MKTPSLLICVFGSACAAVVMAAGSSGKPDLTVYRVGARPLIEGPTANFTGKAKIDRQVRPDESKRMMGSLVSFEAAARTAWHTHPLGQTLIVTSGCGWVQSEGGPKQMIQAGDVVWTPPGVRHWHGAQPHSTFSHYAIAEPLNGSAADWAEKVSDEQYGPQEQGACKTPTKI